jgi:peptidoglycan/xylan/chitin deacetylase (PgdA/CDA1 family)
MYSSVKASLRGKLQTITHFKNLLFYPSKKLVILLYHRILPCPFPNPLGTLVSVENFQKQLLFLKKNYRIISLSQALNNSENAKSGIKIVITFDDGYADNFQYAFPILKDLNISACFFLATDYIGKGTPIWDWKLHLMLRSSRNNVVLKDDLNNKLIEREDYKANESQFLWKLINFLKYLSPEDRSMYLEEFNNQLNVTNINYEEDRCLTWDETRKMQEEGMEFGSHGASHTSLRDLTQEKIDHELNESWKIISSELNPKNKYFALPFGSNADFRQSTITSIRDSGYNNCLLNVKGVNSSRSGQFSLKRKVVMDSSSLKAILG